MEALQKGHYDSIAEKYATHYGDAWSHRYRDRFVYRDLFRNIPLAGKNVVEAMCGSGETTRYLLERGASVTGIEISEQELNAFMTPVAWLRGPMRFHTSHRS